MTNHTITADEEHEFYSRPENQQPQGPPRRRSHRLTAPIPVRFPPELLEEIRRRAADDDRSVSSCIRRAVEREVQRPA
ncbi:MAG: YlcI/YnfO family protein [Nocardioidaceae bacterium]